jgi:hypothetical protein
MADIKVDGGDNMWMEADSKTLKMKSGFQSVSTGPSQYITSGRKSKTCFSNYNIHV